MSDTKKGLTVVALVALLLWLTNQVTIANDGAAYDRVREALVEFGYGPADLALLEATSEVRPLGRRVTARYVRTDGSGEEVTVTARRALAFSPWQIRELSTAEGPPPAASGGR